MKRISENYTILYTWKDHNSNAWKHHNSNTWKHHNSDTWKDQNSNTWKELVIIIQFIYLYWYTYIDIISIIVEDNNYNSWG